jgi:hypothetical protein
MKHPGSEAALIFLMNNLGITLQGMGGALKY